MLDTFQYNSNLCYYESSWLSSVLFQLFDLYLCVFLVRGRKSGEYKGRMNRIGKENRWGKEAKMSRELKVTRRRQSTWCTQKNHRWLGQNKRSVETCRAKERGTPTAMQQRRGNRTLKGYTEVFGLRSHWGSLEHTSFEGRKTWPHPHCANPVDRSKLVKLLKIYFLHLENGENSSHFKDL